MPPSGFNRFLALLCALAFILTAAAVLLLTSVDRELLAAETFKNALATQKVYPQLPAIVSEQLVLSLTGSPCSDNPLRCENARAELTACFQAAVGEAHYRAISAGVERPTETENTKIKACIQQLQPDLQTSQAGSPGVLAFFRQIKADELEKVIAPLLPPNQTQALADSFLDQFFATMNGRQENITLSLTGIKGSLKSPAGLETVLLILRSQPPCTFEQLQELFSITLTGEGVLRLCSPAPELLELLSPFIQSTLSAAVDTIPDTKVLTPLKVWTSRSFGPFGNGAAGAIRLGLTLVQLSPLFPLFFLLLVTLLIVRTLKDFLRWWGIPLLLAGLLVLAAGLIGAGLFEPAWVGLLAGRVPATYSVGLVGTVHDVVKAVLQPFWGNMDLLGGVIAAAGLVMWMVSVFIQPK
jgi:hypothetical protein